MTDHEFPRLALHVLAFLRLREPGNLWNAQYQRWCEANLPREAFQPIAEDAIVISDRLHEHSVALHALVHAFPSRARFLSSRFDLACLPAPLRALDPVGLELLDIALRRCALAFTSDQVESPALPRLDEVRALLREEKVDLRPVAQVRSLGPRGRGYPHVIYVGEPGFLDLDEDTPAAIALHEELVMNAPDSSYREAERYALKRARELPLSAPLREAHERWLSSLDLSAL